MSTCQSVRHQKETVFTQRTPIGAHHQKKTNEHKNSVYITFIYHNKQIQCWWPCIYQIFACRKEYWLHGLKTAGRNPLQEQRIHWPVEYNTQFFYWAFICGIHNSVLSDFIKGSFLQPFIFPIRIKGLCIEEYRKIEEEHRRKWMQRRSDKSYVYF